MKHLFQNTHIDRYLYIIYIVFFLSCGCSEHKKQGGENMEQMVEILSNKAIEITKAKDSILQFHIIDGHNIVITIQRAAHSRPNTFDTGAFEELILEIREDIPKSDSVSANRWIEKAIYQYGSSVLIFQSCNYEGFLTIHELSDKQKKYNGECDLWFQEPTFDRVGAKKAHIFVKF